MEPFSAVTIISIVLFPTDNFVSPRPVIFALESDALPSIIIFSVLAGKFNVYSVLFLSNLGDSSPMLILRDDKLLSLDFLSALPYVFGFDGDVLPDVIFTETLREPGL